MTKTKKKQTMLITGITGMIGSHFRTIAEENGYEVYGIARSSSASRQSVLQDEHIFRSDIMDQAALTQIIKKVKPDVVIHMAAQAFNGMSWQMEEITHQTNILGTHSLLSACREHVPKAKILLACSSAEYGEFETKDCPLKETQPLRPITPYGVSKVATENLGFQFAKNYSMKIYLPRLFIHVGTGHPPATAIQNFARQLALISLGKLKPEMKVGTLETARDFIDVRDGVSAMMLLLESNLYGQPVNICTGNAYKISDILKKLSTIAKVRVKISQEKSLLRPSDEPLLVGDNSLLRSLGWKQKYTIDETLEAVFADWVNRIQTNA